MPKESHLVAYADDGATQTVGILIRKINGWMAAHGVNLGLDKIEVLFLTKKRIPTLVP